MCKGLVKITLIINMYTIKKTASRRYNTERVTLIDLFHLLQQHFFIMEKNGRRTVEIALLLFFYQNQNQKNINPRVKSSVIIAANIQKTRSTHINVCRNRVMIDKH